MSAVSVRGYRSDDANAFRDLNLAWVEAYFTVEAEDRAQLEDPQTHILDQGGAILIAELDGDVVGTAGLVPGHGDGVLELIKMSARSDVQGKGIGRALMDAAIAQARHMGASKIWLETNTVLAAALALYRKSGFRELTGDEVTETPYDRCNCQMVLEL
ncbi:MAG: GNAT family N-acetyltransferase [Henriciella sp.]|nr:GNAT family N-acetyltransferase [Henriciella sp.]MBO6694795.1 GNAT family N-acetyltransferase [Henriciella sp.]